jgi:hypothetical protein
MQNVMHLERQRKECAAYRRDQWHPPVSDRPTLTLYARVGKGEVAQGRWPTTIGGWKTIEKSDGTLRLGVIV